MSDASRQPGTDEVAPDEASGPEGPEAAAKSVGQVLRRLGILPLLGVAWAVLPAVLGILLLLRLGDVSVWLNEHGLAAVVVYMAFFVVTAGLGLLPTYAQAAVAGWVFGALVGVPAALVGFSGAALLGYAVTRVISRDRLEQVIEDHPKSAAVRRALVGRSFGRTLGIVSLLRLPPNSPFALTNLVMASAGVPVVAFFIGTAIGMLPRTAVVVVFAASASATGAADIQTLVKAKGGPLTFVVGLVVLIVVLSIIGSIANRAIERVTTGADPDPD